MIYNPYKIFSSISWKYLKQARNRNKRYFFCWWWLCDWPPTPAFSLKHDKLIIIMDFFYSALNIQEIRRVQWHLYYRLQNINGKWSHINYGHIDKLSKMHDTHKHSGLFTLNSHHHPHHPRTHTHYTHAHAHASARAHLLEVNGYRFSDNCSSAMKPWWLMAYAEHCDTTVD